LLDGIPKIGKVAGCFPNGAATSNLGIKWRIWLDWRLFYPPFLNCCADLLVARNICHGCLARPATQAGRQFGKVVQGMVLNMLLSLACPPIIWAGSGLFISQKDEIRTTSGVLSDPSYLVGEVLPGGNPNSTVVLKRGYLCLVVQIVRAFALSHTSIQTWKQKCVYCPVGSKLYFMKLSEFALLGERSLWIFMGDSKNDPSGSMWK